MITEIVAKIAQGEQKCDYSMHKKTPAPALESTFLTHPYRLQRGYLATAGSV